MGLNMPEFSALASENVPHDITEIWTQAFPGDTLRDISAVWSAAMRGGECLVCRENGSAVSMLLSIPARLVTKNGLSFDMRYVFAAATRKERRGNGIFAELLDYAHRRAREQGVSAMFLHPADEGLFGYYAKLGYRNYFYTDEITLSADEFAAAGHPAADGSVAEWFPRIEWPDHLTACAAAVSGDAKGIVRYKNVRAMYACTGGELFIYEWTAAPDCAALSRAVYRHASARCQFNFVRIRRPAAEKGGSAPFGMVFRLGHEDGFPGAGSLPYMGLAMDI